MPCADSTYQQGLLLSLAACVEAEMRACLDLCSFEISPGGTPAFDSCGCDGCEGRGWITVTGASTYSTLGQDVPSGRCDMPLQLNLDAGLLRCYPVSEDQPDPADLTDLSLLLLNDMMAVRRGLLCCTDLDVITIGYRPIPPTGGCVGGVWSAVLSLL